MQRIGTTPLSNDKGEPSQYHCCIRPIRPQECRHPTLFGDFVGPARGQRRVGSRWQLLARSPKLRVPENGKSYKTRFLRPSSLSDNCAARPKALIVSMEAPSESER